MPARCRRPLGLLRFRWCRGFCGRFCGLCRLRASAAGPCGGLFGCGSRAGGGSGFGPLLGRFRRRGRCLVCCCGRCCRHSGGDVAEGAPNVPQHGDDQEQQRPVGRPARLLGGRLLKPQHNSLEWLRLGEGWGVVHGDKLIRLAGGGQGKSDTLRKKFVWNAGEVRHPRDSGGRPRASEPTR